MDSFGIRQEIESLNKEVNSLRTEKEKLNIHVKELHEEEIRYIKEIPIYKNQAKEANVSMVEAYKLSEIAKSKLGKLQKELMNVRELTEKEEVKLSDLRQTQSKIIEDTKKLNEDVKNRHEQAKQRELAVADREKASELREVGHKNRDLELDTREVDLSKWTKDYENDVQQLGDAIAEHSGKVEDHNKKVDIFIQTKELHLSDEQILKDKMEKANKLIKDNIDLKAVSLLQSDKLLKELQATKQKQDSLDRNIADLKNQENILKIKELKIQKMAHDAGLQKELKELEESLK